MKGDRELLGVLVLYIHINYVSVLSQNSCVPRIGVRVVNIRTLSLRTFHLIFPLPNAVITLLSLLFPVSSSSLEFVTALEHTRVPPLYETVSFSHYCSLWKISFAYKCTRSYFRTKLIITEKINHRVEVQNVGKAVDFYIGCDVKINTLLLTLHEINYVQKLFLSFVRAEIVRPIDTSISNLIGASHPCSRE